MLEKSLYGIKQAGYEWNKCLSNVLKGEGFHQGIADPCVFTRGKGQQRCIVLCFVDDLAIMCKSNEQATDVLRKKFTLRDLGKIHKYVGLEITEVSHGYKISQREKIAHLLQKYNMEQCNGVKTPMAPDFEKDETPSPMFDPNMYKSLLGSLMYLSQWSRPDTAMACNLLARASSQPMQRLAAKRILRYLKQTIYMALYLEPMDELKLTAYVDASFASDTETRVYLRCDTIPSGILNRVEDSRAETHVTVNLRIRIRRIKSDVLRTCLVQAINDRSQCINVKTNNCNGGQSGSHPDGINSWCAGEIKAH